jgi:hypothetical protein
MESAHGMGRNEKRKNDTMKNDTTQIKLNKIQQTKATRIANLFAKRGQIQIAAKTKAKMLKGGRAKAGVYPNALLNADETGNVPTVELLWNQLAEFVPYPVARAEYIERTGEEIAERGANPAESIVNDCPAIIHNANTGNIRIQYRPLTGKRDVKLLVNGEDATPEQIEIFNQFQPKKGGEQIMASVGIDNITAFIPAA